MEVIIIEVEIDDDKLFALLQSTNSRPPYFRKMSIDDRLGQSMKSGDNCTGKPESKQNFLVSVKSSEKMT